MTAGGEAGSRLGQPKNVPIYSALRFTVAYGISWPFAGDPIVEDGFVQLVVAPDAWEAEVPALVERAHRRGLTAVDPQWEELFPPGEPYAEH
jgi:hypothetical protein